MHIAIYGGSFNPIHNGHLHLAREVRRQMLLDEVWLMVSPHNPFKQSGTLLNDDLRLQLVEAAVKNETGLVACDFEFSLPRPSYTWNTLQALQKKHPNHQFSLLVGGDNWKAFDRWYACDKILSNYNIIIYPRQGSPIDAASLPPNVTLLNTRLYDISSSEIRRLVRIGQPVRHLVPSAVEEKIVEYYSR